MGLGAWGLRLGTWGWRLEVWGWIDRRHCRYPNYRTQPTYQTGKKGAGADVLALSPKYGAIAEVRELPPKYGANAEVRLLR